MARAGAKDRGVVFKEGKWWVRLFLNGRERWFRCENKTQAKALYGRLKANEREGQYFKKEKPLPFRQLAKDYAEEVDTTRRGRTGDDRARIQRWVTAFGDQDAKTLTLSQIRAVHRTLRKEQKKPATIHRHLTVLKAILNHADGLETLLTEIRKKIKVPEGDNKLVRYLTPEQESTLMAHLPHKYHPIVVVAINTGCRQGELLRVRRADIDWNLGIMTIRESKTGESRRAPLNSLVQAVLAKIQADLSPSPTDLVFPLDARHLRRTFDKAVRESALAPFRFHDLRHAWASRLAMQGANDRTLMALGGWKSPAMLIRYAHLSPTHLWAAVEGLTKLGTGSKTGSEEKGEQVEGVQPIEKTGEPPGIRTRDPRLKRAMLYHLS